MDTPNGASDSCENMDWVFENIKAASHHASVALTMLFAFLLYGLVTTASLTDRQVALNQGIILPIADTTIKYILFVIAYPVISLVVFLILMAYVVRIHGLVAVAKTSEVGRQYGRIYPWLLCFLFDADSKLTGRFQRFIARASLWLILPLTLLIHAFATTRTHNVPLIVSAYCAAAISAIVADRFKKRIDPPKHKWILGSSNWFIFWVSCGLACWSLYFPRTGLTTGLWANLNLKYEVLVNKPTEDQEFSPIPWGQFSNLHWEGANLTSSVLRKAFMDGIHLEWANLAKADFLRSSLISADLRFTDMRGADLKLSKLRNANLNQADLRLAHLEETNFQDADVSEVCFDGAFLQRADLRNVRGLKPDQLDFAWSTYGIKLDSNMFSLVRSRPRFMLSQKPRGRFAVQDSAKTEYIELEQSKILEVNILFAKYQTQIIDSLLLTPRHSEEYHSSLFR